jgi:hypothetical protein
LKLLATYSWRNDKKRLHGRNKKKKRAFGIIRVYNKLDERGREKEITVSTLTGFPSSATISVMVPD